MRYKSCGKWQHQAVAKTSHYRCQLLQCLGQAHDLASLFGSALASCSNCLCKAVCYAGLDVALLLYISLLGSAASYGVFFYNASKGNLTKLSSLTFLTPMFAAGCGYLFLGEGLNPLQLGGATVTLGAVALLNTGQSDAPEES